jgi:2-C-methyl-D-erythritol 4-phosphate cytidylyltransferase
MKPPRIAVIITAAGSSSRMGLGGLKKEYRPLPGRFDREGNPLTVLGAAAEAFAAAAIEAICCIVITIPPSGEDAARAALPGGLLLGSYAKPLTVALVAGGPTRRASVHNALTALSDCNPGYVLIHDGARPWVDEALIRRTIDAVMVHNAVVPLLPLTETPKEIDDVGGKPPFVCRHLKRSQIGGAQTPQAFAYPAILRAHEKAALREREEGAVYTDDAEVWGEFAGPVAVVEGSPQNRKITFAEDLA